MEKGGGTHDNNRNLIRMRGDSVVLGDFLHIKGEIELGHRAGNGRDDIFACRKRDFRNGVCLEFACESFNAYGVLAVKGIDGYVLFFKRVALEGFFANRLLAVLYGKHKLCDIFVGVVCNVDLLLVIHLSDNEGTNEIGLERFCNGLSAARKERNEHQCR